MATVTSTPTATSLSISGRTTVNGTISWSLPSVPSEATVTSRVLSGTVNISMSKGSCNTLTVNGTSIERTNGATFEIDLGASSTVTSVTTRGAGNNNNARGAVTFTNLVYTVTYQMPLATYTVTFVDWDGTVLKTQEVEEGNSATPPSNPTREGYTFTGWSGSYTNVTSDTTVTAQYSINTYTVTFKDWDGTTLKTETVNHGNNATAPSNPTRNGYTFIGWSGSYTNVTSDRTITAQYERNGTYNICMGSDIVNNVYIGNTQVTKIYVGDTLVFEQ